jgi:hypothetical protein
VCIRRPRVPKQAARAARSRTRGRTSLTTHHHRFHRVPYIRRRLCRWRQAWPSFSVVSARSVTLRRALRVRSIRCCRLSVHTRSLAGTGPSLPERFKDWPLTRVVVSLIPQVGGRQNEVRYEVIVSAFSRSLALKSGDAWITALGDDPPEVVRKCLADAEFAVVFKPQSVRH